MRVSNIAGLFAGVLPLIVSADKTVLRGTLSAGPGNSALKGEEMNHRPGAPPQPMIKHGLGDRSGLKKGPHAPPQPPRIPVPRPPVPHPPSPPSPPTPSNTSPTICPTEALRKVCPSSAHSEQDTTAHGTVTQQSGAVSSRKKRILAAKDPPKSKNLDSDSDHGGYGANSSNLRKAVLQGEGSTGTSGNAMQIADDEEETTSKELEKLSRMETAGGGDYIEPSLKAIEGLAGFDGTTTGAFTTLGSMSEIVGMVVPPPAGVVVSLGMAILGSFFGAQMDDVNPYDKIEEQLKEIYEGQAVMTAAIGDLKVSMDVLTRMTQYNIKQVASIYQKL